MKGLYIGEECFNLGTKKHITIAIEPVCECLKNLPFSIVYADYELIDREGNIEEFGECKIIGHKLDIYISPRKASIYKLQCTYKIADEEFVDVVRIKVV